jgi:broad specificity phosphatase PhoE
MRREEKTDMRIIEVRRHTMRMTPGQHLSQAGVTLARRVGDSTGPFDRVIASTLPRAYETAIAMGYAVDEQTDALSHMGFTVSNGVAWPAPFDRIARTVQGNNAVGVYARDQANLWRSYAAVLPDGGAALIISHGGIVELGAVAALPEADHAAWGAHIDYCEGIRLVFEDGVLVSGQILRVAAS